MDVIETEIKCQARRLARDDARWTAMDTECASHTRRARAGPHEHEQHEHEDVAEGGHHKIHFGRASRKARGSALRKGEARASIRQDTRADAQWQSNPSSHVGPSPGMCATFRGSELLSSKYLYRSWMGGSNVFSGWIADFAAMV